MGDKDYVYPPNSIGGTLPFTPQVTYAKNGEIDIEVLLTAHHKGHFEYHICPLGPNEDVPTQGNHNLLDLLLWAHQIFFSNITLYAYFF